MSAELIFFLNVIGVILVNIVYSVVFTNYFLRKLNYFSLERDMEVKAKHPEIKNYSKAQINQYFLEYYSSEKISNRISDFIGVLHNFIVWSIKIILCIAFVINVIYLWIDLKYTYENIYILWLYFVANIFLSIVSILIVAITKLLTNRIPGEAKSVRQYILTNENKKNERNLYNLSLLIYALFAKGRGALFYETDIRKLDVPERCRAILVSSISAYQIYAYLSIIGNRFGKEIEVIAKEYLIIVFEKECSLGSDIEYLISLIEKGMLSFISLQNSVSNDGKIFDVSLDYYMAYYLMINMPGSPYSLKKNKDDTPDYFEDDKKIFVNYLASARNLVITKLTPMIDDFNFDKNALRHTVIPGLDYALSKEVKWSDKPGRYERHLQIKYKNSLFPEKERFPSILDVESAQKKDLEENNKIRDEVNTFIKSWPSELPSDFFNFFQDYREKIDNLREKVLKIGGDASDVLKILYELKQGLLNTARINVSNNKKLQDLLEDAIKFDEEKYEPFWKNPFIAQAFRENGTVNINGILPTLLSEDVIIIKDFLSSTEPEEFIVNIKNEVKKLLRNANLNDEKYEVFEAKMIAIFKDKWIN